MERERYQRIKEVLFEASRRTGAERRDFLARACAGDPALRGEVERLLDSDPVRTREIADLGGQEPEMPETLGPYRLERELGRGGMGAVYAAVDGAGRRVALKVVHPHLVAATHLVRRFRREAEAGRRVSHDNVVRTLAVEQAGAAHFLVMEYVAGKTLRDLLTELETVPEALLREIAQQVAAGLAAIHAAGIVHRDLKPENVLITDDQRVRIMDLGIAKLQESVTHLTREGQFLGSLHYAAPEQCTAGEIGPPADLYALGVVLYELATGENPFRRDSPGAIIRAHLDDVPRPALEVNPDLSPFLTSVLATLLQKEPERRFASAAELHAVLAAAEDGPWWAERERGLSQLVPTIPIRRETRLHGREAEIEVLQDAWREARAGRGRTVLLEGEAGLGKTRLLDAFLRRLDTTDIHVLYGSYPPTPGLTGLTDAIVGKFGAGLEESLARYLRGSAALVPGFAAFLRREVSDATALRGDTLPALCCRLMHALADEKPTIWIVDDLHFAPEEGRAVARAMARAVGSHPVLLVLTARPGPTLGPIADARRISLERLSPREVVELLRDAFGSEELADRLGGKIAFKSDGVPFFVFEMIRGLKEGGLLERTPDGSLQQTRPIEELEVPSAIRDLIGSRLRELAKDERTILDIGAVVGHEFDAESVAPVLGRPLVAVLQELAEVERRHGIVRAAGRRYRFDHHQIQEVVYADLPPRLREEYHALLAEAYEARLGGEPKKADRHFLAHHHLRGSRPERGLPHLAAALDYLRHQFRNEEAVALADLALEKPGLLTGTARVETLLALQFRLGMLGRGERLAGVLDEAFALAEEIGDPVLRVQTRRARARRLGPSAQSERALALLDEAEELAAGTDDLALQGSVAGTRSLVLYHEGRFEETRRYAQRQIELATEAGDLDGQAVAWGRVGLVHIDLGDLDRAQECLERTLELCRKAGDPWTEGVTIGNLGLLSRMRGHWEQALARYDLYYALSQQFVYRQGEVIGAHNIADLLTMLGRHEEARRFADTGLLLARELGRSRHTGRALLAMAKLEQDTEAFDDARRHFEEAYELLHETGDRVGEAECRLYRAGLEARQGRNEEALRHLDAMFDTVSERESSGAWLLALGKRVALRPEDADDVARRLDEQGHRTDLHVRMEVRYRLWQATGDRARLEEAKLDLEYLRDHAPESDRERMVRAVPLHREIEGA